MTTTTERTTVRVRVTNTGMLPAGFFHVGDPVFEAVETGGCYAARLNERYPDWHFCAEFVEVIPQVLLTALRVTGEHHPWPVGEIVHGAKGRSLWDEFWVVAHPDGPISPERHDNAALMPEGWTGPAYVLHELNFEVVQEVAEQTAPAPQQSARTRVKVTQQWRLPGSLSVDDTYEAVETDDHGWMLLLPPGVGWPLDSHEAARRAIPRYGLDTEQHTGWFVPPEAFTVVEEAASNEVGRLEVGTLVLDSIGDVGVVVASGDQVTVVTTNAEVTGPATTFRLAPVVEAQEQEQALVEALARHTEQAQQEAQRLRDERDTVRRQHEQWLDSFVEAAHEWADDQEFCGVFDNCMEALGLDPRVKTEEIDVDLRVYGTVTVDGSDVEGVIDRMGDSTASVSGSAEFEVMYEATTTVTVDTDSCGCGEVNTDDDHGIDFPSSFDYDRTEMRCENCNSWD